MLLFPVINGKYKLFKTTGGEMNRLVLLIITLSICLSAIAYTQKLNKITNAEKDTIEAVAKNYLNCADKHLAISLDIICTESLVKAKDLSISMRLRDTLTKMMQLPLDSIKAMTPGQLWDYEEFLYGTMRTDEMKIEWSIAGTEIKDGTAFVTYNVKDRPQKVMKLKKENDRWKIILSFDSIF
jgi:hypothetical protein